MFLRSLAIRGFKSFADRTTLEFTPGVSVIVGPNGSGKSNIADAIAWVLGEQGPRALRGAQMADVIFAGSPSRPPLGMAEVSLVIDNTAGLIPVPASEIEISRSVFRSGESEYRLGGRPCRLLDIQELLSDTGIGRALHTIIGQGHLEDVLQARPEERRQYVEEAAGIAKHRRRRERAERKLAGMEGDLLRLQDLLGELRRQLKPLKQQAELAGRHDALTKEAGELAGRLAAARLRQLHQERERRRPAWDANEARQAEARGRLAELDREIARLEGARGEAETALGQADELHTAALEEKSSAESALRGAIREEARAKERLATATGRSGRLFALEEELQRTERALAEVASSLERAEADLQEAEAAFRLAEAARRDAEAEGRARAEAAAARRAEIDAGRHALQGAESEMARLRAGLSDVAARSRRSEAQAEQLQGRIESLDASVTPASDHLAKVERERSELAGSLADLQVRERGLRARLEVIEQRRAELAESPGQAFFRRRGGRSIGLLAELVRVPPDLVPAVRAALGPLADAVVYVDRASALADAAAEPVGGITMAVANEPRPIGERSPMNDPSPDDRLLDLIHPDPRVRNLFHELLSETYLAASLAEAAARQRAYPRARFVTREGAVVAPAFVRTSPGLDHRLDEVRREAASLGREMAGVRRGLREGRTRLGRLETDAARLRAQLEETDGRITAAAEQLAGVRADEASLRRERSLMEERLAAAEATATSARGRLAAAGVLPEDPPPLPPLPQPPVRLRVDVEAMRRERARLEGGVARARHEIQALAAEDPVTLRGAAREAETARERCEEALGRAEENAERALAAYRAATARAQQARARHDAANRSWRAQAGLVEQLREEHEDEDRARGELDRRVADAERLLREGHGLDPDEAVAALPADDTVESLQRRSEMVARRLTLLGRVNLLAQGELGAVQERHDFLARELQDVRAASRDLQRVIEEIDVRMAELFDSAFRDVAQAFTELFATLFPGGEGRLSLTDPADPLGSGIEVEARPGRKRVRRLSLLSGGERSLAALAFLFAIFRARPSPFYLMDEVEAALDDINLHRFLDVVRGFAATSQILIVTHQKRTMEMADVLYGVSMGQGGASRVIAQRLSEVAVGG